MGNDVDDHGSRDVGVAKAVEYESRSASRWLERLPGLEQASGRATAMAPTLVGLTLAQAQAAVDADSELTLEVVQPSRGPRPPVGRFGHIEVVVRDGRVVRAR